MSGAFEHLPCPSFGAYRCAVHLRPPCSHCRCAPHPAHSLPASRRYLDDTIAHLRKGITKAEAPPKAKKGEAPAAPKKVRQGACSTPGCEHVAMSQAHCG